MTGQTQLSASLKRLLVQLTATIIGKSADFVWYGELTMVLPQKIDRTLLCGYPHSLHRSLASNDTAPLLRVSFAPTPHVC